MNEVEANATDAMLDEAVNVAAPDGRDYAGKERRVTARHPYDRPVCLVLFAEDGSLLRSLHLQGKDLSGSGIGVVSRCMINPGREGAMRLLRSDGQAVVVGVKSVRCRYVGQMMHETGFRFVPLSAAVTPQDFDPDRHG